MEGHGSPYVFTKQVKVWKLLICRDVWEICNAVRWQIPWKQRDFTISKTKGDHLEYIIFLLNTLITTGSLVVFFSQYIKYHRFPCSMLLNDQGSWNPWKHGEGIWGSTCVNSYKHVVSESCLLFIWSLNKTEATQCIFILCTPQYQIFIHHK